MIKQSDNPARVVLNCMPPSHIMMPLAALNILKCFLRQNSFQSEIIYWNIKFEKDLFEWDQLFGGENYEFSRLIPFIYNLSKDYSDDISREKIFNLVEQAALHASADKSKEKARKSFSSLPEKTSRKINSIISSELANFDFTGVILSGFSAKFYQWLPALKVAGETKKLYPHIKTIIGGIDSRSTAEEMLKNFSCFDFAVWGEGEYPLLELSKALAEHSENFSEIAGVVYRKGKQIISSQKTGRKYFDMNHYPEPDYDDFFSVVKEDRAKGIFLYYPVETIRGCNWNKCKFCALAKGYKYRERNADSVVSEIRAAIRKYNIGYFQFLDNNLIGCNKERLDELLNKLKKLFIESDDDFTCFTEIIPSGLDASVYKKMAVAGFRMAQVGGESLTDSLIRKMNKMNSFSDNLLAYKFCLKYGIKPDGANIITGIPGETAKDVGQCIDNIHFLRFFTGEHLITFNESAFVLEKSAKFYKEISDAEKENYNIHLLYNLLPARMTATMNRFELFHFRRNKLINQNRWKLFFEVLASYSRAHFTYKIYSVDDLKIYEEFRKRDKIASLMFDKPEQWEILVIANQQLRTFDEMLALLRHKFKSLTAAKLKKMLKELKAHYLVYFDENFNKIVSVIDTDMAL